jgi:hypothetical protein
MSLKERFDEVARLLAEFIRENPKIQTSKDLEKAFAMDLRAYLRARRAMDPERN